ncbi:MAG: solute:sodium symporter family transporter [Planctomycetaceae bacterium]|nr:solute:sodium symporter family transporter [Planctomycetaceae bacterium]
MLPLIAFIFFTGLVGLLTWMLTRRDDHGSSTGYFLAGRSLTGGYIAGSLLLTNLSTEQLVGLNGDAYRDGVCVMAWEVIAALSLVILALLYLPKYLKSGIATVPQFLEERFDKGTRDICTIIFLFAYAVILLPFILLTGATGLIDILNLPELTGIDSRPVLLWGTVWAIGVIGSIYAIFGGLRTVAVSDTLNGFGLLTGGILIAWYGLLAVNPDGAVPAIETLYAAHPEKFNSLGGPDTSVPFSTLFTGVLLLNLFYWTTNQQIIQRTFGAKSLAEGQRGVIMAGFLKVLAPIILVLPGIIAFHLFSADGLHGDRAYGTLVQTVLPKPLVGFFAAAVFGAILSSFNSVLNSAATLFSLNTYQGMLRPDASESEVIKVGKTFGTGVAIFAMVVAPLLDGRESLFQYLQKMNGLYFIPIFAVMLVGLCSRNVPAIAAKTALIVGCLVIALGYFVPVLSQYVDALGGFHFLGAVLEGLILLMLLIGAAWPRETPWEQKDSKDVDLTPWKFAFPSAAALVAVVLTIYISLADISAFQTNADQGEPAPAISDDVS